MGEDILFKVHKSYREVVSVCDKDVFGRKLKEGERCLDMSVKFFEGDAMDEATAYSKMRERALEDATFNVVGEKSVGIALRLGIVKEEGIIRIEGVPVALVLL